MDKKRIWTLGKPLIAEAAVTGAAILLLSFLMLKLEWGMEQARLGIWWVYGLACFFGGLAAGTAGGQKKFLRGLAYGSLYFFLLIMAALAAGGSPAQEPGELLGRFGVCAFSGMAGGMMAGFFGNK